MLIVHILKIPIPIPFKFPEAQIQYIFGWLEIVENLGRKIRCEKVIIFQIAFSWTGLIVYNKPFSNVDWFQFGPEML